RRRRAPRPLGRHAQRPRLPGAGALPALAPEPGARQGRLRHVLRGRVLRRRAAMSGTWSILGLGNFVWDVIDTIESRGGVVERVVLNMEVDRGLVARLPAAIEGVGVGGYRTRSASRCFMFTS